MRRLFWLAIGLLLLTTGCSQAFLQSMERGFQPYQHQPSPYDKIGPIETNYNYCPPEPVRVLKFNEFSNQWEIH